jgi:hypothetical protein
MTTQDITPEMLSDVLQTCKQNLQNLFALPTQRGVNKDRYVRAVYECDKRDKNAVDWSMSNGTSLALTKACRDFAFNIGDNDNVDYYQNHLNEFLEYISDKHPLDLVNQFWSCGFFLESLGVKPLMDIPSEAKNNPLMDIPSESKNYSSLLSNILAKNNPILG